MDHQTGDGILRRVIKAEEDLESIFAHLRAIVQNPDSEWTGWRHAIEMLIPDSSPRLDELEEELRARGKDATADRLAELRMDSPSEPGGQS